MIKVENIIKSYGKVNVIKDISFTLGKAEILAIIGASGAGKTTLLQIMGSLESADSGDVIIDNVSLKSLSNDKLADFRNKKIGFVFQFHHLLPEFTALENVMMPALISGTKWETAKIEALRILKTLSMDQRANHKPSQLSGGEAQRVAIARAIINNPLVLFADEPSGNLDSANKKELNNIFLELRDKFGLTIILVTHDENLAEIADVRIELKDGKRI